MGELVGEIHDEYDRDAEVAAAADPETVDAGLTIEEFGERTGVALADGPYETVGHAPRPASAADAAAEE